MEHSSTSKEVLAGPMSVLVKFKRLTVYDGGSSTTASSRGTDDVVAVR
jgi:hypothetical protein